MSNKIKQAKKLYEMAIVEANVLTARFHEAQEQEQHIFNQWQQLAKKTQRAHAEMCEAQHAAQAAFDALQALRLGPAEIDNHDDEGDN